MDFAHTSEVLSFATSTGARLSPLYSDTGAGLLSEPRRIRSAQGHLANSGMSCSETIIKEGTSLCVAGHAVVTSSSKGLKKGRGRLRVVVGSTRDCLVRPLRTWARSYGVMAVALLAIAISECVLQLHEHEVAWALGGLALLGFGGLLWTWRSV